MQMPWPSYDESKTVDSTKEIAVQVNGKLKTTVVIPMDADEETAIGLPGGDAAETNAGSAKAELTGEPVEAPAETPAEAPVVETEEAPAETQPVEAAPEPVEPEEAPAEPEAPRDDVLPVFPDFGL